MPKTKANIPTLLNLTSKNQRLIIIQLANHTLLNNFEP